MLSSEKAENPPKNIEEDKMKNRFLNKAPGFRVLLCAIAASLVTAVAYAIIYSSTRFMSWAAFGILIGGAALALALVLCGLERFAPSVMLVASLIALMFHIYYIYFFISSVATGIQFSGFPLDFYVNFVLYGITLVLSIVCVFMPVEEK